MAPYLCVVAEEGYMARVARETIERIGGPEADQVLNNPPDCSEDENL